MAALCLSWNVGHDKLRWALIATLVFAVSGNLAASEDGPFWHAACMLLSCHSWKKWCHNAIAGVFLIHLVPQRFEEMPAKLRYLKAIKNCSIHFSPYFRPTFISISSTSLLCKASCECYCSIGSLGPQIKRNRRRECQVQVPVDQAEGPNHDKGNRKACCHPVPCHPTGKGSCDYVRSCFFPSYLQALHPPTKDTSRASSICSPPAWQSNSSNYQSDVPPLSTSMKPPASLWPNPWLVAMQYLVTSVTDIVSFVLRVIETELVACRCSFGIGICLHFKKGRQDETWAMLDS